MTTQNGFLVKETVASWVNAYSANAYVSAISVGVGGSAGSSYHAFADNVVFDTTTGTTTFNFEANAATVDSVAPAAPAITSPGGLTNTLTQTVVGTAEADSAVLLNDGAALLGTTTASAQGQWTHAVMLAGQGVHALTATATDAAGNTGAASAVVTLTVDSIAPAAPVALAVAPANDSGVPGDGITNVAWPTLTGAAEADSTVALTDTADGAIVFGTVKADGSGRWSFTPGAALTEGVHNVTATATDAAGNTSAASAALALVIDTTTPVITARLLQDTGLNYDGVTGDPTLTGAADPGATVSLGEGAVLLGEAVADNSGLWSLTPAGLAEGSHTVVVSGTDTAGNPGSAKVNFVLSTTAPTTDYTLVDGFGARSEGILTPNGQSGPGIARGFSYAGAGGATILARADNVRLRGGTRDDAIVAQGGRNVLDGGGGSDWLVGGAGQDTFIIDARGGNWSTVVGFRAGDDVAVRGIENGASTFQWSGTDGAGGYQGATLSGSVDGGSLAFSVTLAGLTVEAAKRYAAVNEREADGTPVLRLRASSPAAPEEASYEVTHVTTGVASVSLLDPYQGAVAELRYQHVEAGDAPVALVARASDSLLRSGAGDDAMLVRNGDNVLDAGAGSNWLVGGAGSDTFLVEAIPDQPTWNTVVNFHAGDVLMMRGYEEGVSNWGWSAAVEGAAGFKGATLRGALNGRDVDFSLTLAGITVEHARSFDVSAMTASDGVESLSIRV